MIKANDLNTLYKRVVTDVYSSPDFTPSPRGMATREKLAVTFRLDNPRARIITSEYRKVNYGFGIGEFIWYWTGRRDLAFIQRYNSRLKNFSDDGETLNSAYGYRIFGPQGHGITGTIPGHGQWRIAAETLRRDPDSRQAIVHILRQEDLQAPTKDVPCTCTLQFFIRDGRLCLHAHMRSNDLFWGTPYDVFSFTLMQEAMSLELGVDLGPYYHTAGSMHIYERHFEDANGIMHEREAPSEPMPPLVSLDSLWSLQASEPYVSTGEKVPSRLGVAEGSGEAWMLDVLTRYWEKKLDV